MIRIFLSGLHLVFYLSGMCTAFAQPAVSAEHAKNWNGRKASLTLKEGQNNTLRGMIIRIDENGILFDQAALSPFYNPGEKFYPFAEIEKLVSGNGKTLYTAELGLLSDSVNIAMEGDAPVSKAPVNLEQESYPEFGINIGTPGVLNVVLGHWFQKAGLSVSGMYLGNEAKGIQLNLNYKLSDNSRRRHALAIIGGASQLEDKYWTYAGIAYNLCFKSFFLETGFVVGEGDFKNPQLSLQIGYMRRFVNSKKLGIKSNFNDPESWYFYMALGYANINYGNDLSRELMINLVKRSAKRFSMSSDWFGFYWPRGEKTLVGGVINSFMDRYEDGFLDDQQLNGFMFSLSSMRFLTHKIGEGVFARGDIGIARIGYDGLLNFHTEDSQWGFGFLLGTGYALPVSGGTRLLFNANYALRLILEEINTTLALSVGVLL